MSFLNTIICSLTLVFLVPSVPQNGVVDSGAISKEYQIKAAFLFNFTQFVDWPESSYPNTQAPLVIGILGDDPFGPFLDETVANEKAKGRNITVKRYKNIDELGNCHILFINYKDDKLGQVFNKLSGKSVLTVGESKGFIEHGGIVKFFLKDNKIMLQINPDTAKDAKITISSKLLRLSEIVSTKRTN